MTALVKDFYQTHNIPFREITNGTFETLNTIIKIRKFTSLIHHDCVVRLCKQINENIFKPAYIYIENIYIENIENEEIFTKIKHFIETNTINSCVIHDINEYFFNEYSSEIRYGIIHTGALWSLVSKFEEMYSIINGNYILINPDVYKRAIVIMTDDEIELLWKYNIHIIDISDIEVCIITQDTYNTRTKFIHKINYMPLVGGNRIPIRIEEGITYLCEQCNRIFYCNRQHNC